MKNPTIRTLSFCTVLLFLAVGASAQSKSNDDVRSQRPDSTSALEVPGKVAVVVVGSAAKATWATTKFTAKHVAKPVGKAVFVKAVPAVGKFAFKKSLKHLVPLAVKLSIL